MTGQGVNSGPNWAKNACLFSSMGLHKLRKADGTSLLETEKISIRGPLDLQSNCLQHPQRK